MCIWERESKQNSPEHDLIKHNIHKWKNTRYLLIKSILLHKIIEFIQQNIIWMIYNLFIILFNITSTIQSI